MFSGMFTCQEAGVEQSNLRSALDVALKQGGKPCHGWGNCLGNMLVTFNIGTLMESLPICKGEVFFSFDFFFGSSGPLVPWSSGPLVLRSSGPLVPRSSCPLVLWSPGPLV